MILDLDDLRGRLRARLDADGAAWLDETEAAVHADPTAIRSRFPAVGRRVGKGPLDGDGDPSEAFAWTVDDAARTVLLAACGDDVTGELDELYRYGDAAERRAILRALPFLTVGDAGMPLVLDALRTNDTRLVAAALSPYAVERLDEDSLRQAVLKCVFVGIPVDAIAGLEAHADAELSRMLAAYALERVTAGRDVPAEIWPLVDRHPPAELLAAIEAERDSEFPDRRAAAEAALAARAAAATTTTTEEARQ